MQGQEVILSTEQDFYSMASAGTVPPATRYDEIFIFNRLSASRRLKESISRRVGYVPLLQPEIDMIFTCTNGSVLATEVKFFDLRGKSIALPFYAGIGQALALTRLGFDYVSLVHMFPDTTPVDKINEYGSATWFNIRNDLKLPLDFSYLYVRHFSSLKTDPNRIQFAVMQYTSPKNGFELSPTIISPSFRMTWKNPNPLRQAYQSILECIKDWLMTKRNPQR